MIIEWDYDIELEKKLIKNKELLEFCWSLRNETAHIDRTVIISTRGILTLEKVFQHNKKTKAFKNEEILKQKFFETIKKDHLHKIIQDVGKTMHKNSYYQYLELLAS